MNRRDDLKSRLPPGSPASSETTRAVSTVSADSGLSSGSEDYEVIRVKPSQQQPASPLTSSRALRSPPPPVSPTSSVEAVNNNNVGESGKKKCAGGRRTKKMLPCDYCGKCFDRPSLLNRHLRTHTGERPHVCDICDKGFSTSSSLNTHRRIHSGEKPHQCNVCGKRFTASSNLYYHRMTHIKVREMG